MQSLTGMVLLLSVLFIVLPYSTILAAPQSEVKTLVQGNSSFTIDLYQKLRASEGNLFLSPYSISTALAMTYGGARGNTEKEMVKTLRFSLNQERLHPAFADLESRLNKVQEAGNVKLSVANSLWPQRDYEFLPKYLSLIKKNYGVSITPVDYKVATETARTMINRWVEEKTQDKIKDLIPPGLLNTLTRLVLTNAIYFKGNWESKFDPVLTKDAPFFLSSGKSVQTPLMYQTKEFKYGEFESLQILEMPYVGKELSILVLLPKEIGGLKALEGSLSLEKLMQWRTNLYERKVLVIIPKFKMTSTFELGGTLQSMGMVDAFSFTNANFAGMDGRTNWLYISAVLHKAFVDVNEEGTEAAAATAVTIKAMGLPPPRPTFCADHPFVFMIQDNQTGSILFIGRMTDPTKTGE